MSVNLTGTVYWASTVKPNVKSGKYQYDLGNLTDEDVSKLERVGLGPKVNDKGDERGKFITAKSDYPIKVMNQDREILNILVGNGSKVWTPIDPVPYTKHGGGIMAGAGPLMVLELVEYKPKESLESAEFDESEFEEID